MSARLTAFRELHTKAEPLKLPNGLVHPPKMVEETLTRGATYRSAGADGLFVPALSDEDQIIAVIKGTVLPLNVMAVPKLADAKRLGSLGVKRVSAGSGIAQATWATASSLGRWFLDEGNSGVLTSAMAYADLQALFD